MEILLKVGLAFLLAAPLLYIQSRLTLARSGLPPGYTRLFRIAFGLLTIFGLLVAAAWGTIVTVIAVALFGVLAPSAMSRQLNSTDGLKTWVRGKMAEQPGLKEKLSKSGLAAPNVWDDPNVRDL